KPRTPRCGRNEGCSYGAGLHVKPRYIAHFRSRRNLRIGCKTAKKFGDFGARSRLLIVRSVAGSGRQIGALLETTRQRSSFESRAPRRLRVFVTAGALALI